MNLFTLIKNKFNKKDTRHDTAINRIFNHLSSLTKNNEIKSDFLYKFKKIERKAKREGDVAYASIYLEWEEFVLNKKNESQKKKESSENFRASIKNIDLNILDEDFKLIFLPVREQTIHLYEHFTKYLLEHFIENIGSENLKSLLSDLNEDHILKTLRLDKELDFTDINEKIESDIVTYPLDKITRDFKHLMTLLHNKIEATLGDKTTKTLFKKIYVDLKNTYNSEFAGIILRITPEKAMELSGFLSILSKKELEERVEEKTFELERLNSSLEKEVDKRTVELRKAYEDLKELDKQKSEFISVAAHQLRTPLSGIKWTVNSLLKGDLGGINKTQREFLKKTANTNEYIISIINSLIDADKITKGLTDYHFTKVHVYELLKQVVDDMKPQITKADIKVKILNKEDIVIESDLDKLTMVFSNILDNAIKYSKHGGEIVIDMKVINSIIQVSVKDGGIGIPKDSQDRIFSRFFRAPNAIRTEASGNGLGLFIIKNIVEDHGGRIWFDSKEGRGTTFFITLPIRQELDEKGVDNALLSAKIS